MGSIRPSTSPFFCSYGRVYTSASLRLFNSSLKYAYSLIKAKRRTFAPRVLDTFL
jgi:hypothetical protein